MAREDWKRTEEGHECDYDLSDLDPTIYPDEAACLDAIEQQHGYRK